MNLNKYTKTSINKIRKEMADNISDTIGRKLNEEELKSLSAAAWSSYNIIKESYIQDIKDLDGQEMTLIIGNGTTIKGKVVFNKKDFTREKFTFFRFPFKVEGERNRRIIDASSIESIVLK